MMRGNANRRELVGAASTVAVVAFAAVVALAAMGAGTGVVAGATVYESWTWEDGADGWDTSQSGVTVVNQGDTGDNSLKINTTSDVFAPKNITAANDFTLNGTTKYSGGADLFIDYAAGDGDSVKTLSLQMGSGEIYIQSYDESNAITESTHLNAPDGEWFDWSLTVNGSNATLVANGNSTSVTLADDEGADEVQIFTSASTSNNAVYYDTLTLYQSSEPDKTATLTGTITDTNGSAVANATVAVFANGERLATTETDGTGSYSTSVKLSADERYRVEAAKPSAGYGVVGKDAGPVSNDTTVDLTLEAGTVEGNIRGTVENDVGQTLEGVRVVAVDGDGVAQDSAYTGENGEFVINRTSGYTELEFHYPGYETRTVDLGTLEDGEQVDLGTVTLTATNVGVSEDDSIVDGNNSLVGPNGSDASIENLRNNTSASACDVQSAALETTTATQGFLFESLYWATKDSVTEDVCSDRQSTTRIDLLQSAVAVNESTQQYFTTLRNFLDETRGSAYTKGKIAAIEALNNNATKAQARQQARAAINNYYATIERNVLSRWEVETAQANYIVGVENNQASTVGTTDNVGWVGPVRSSPTSFRSSFGTDDATEEMLVSLPNGETTSVVTVVVDGSDVLTPWSENTTNPDYTPSENGIVRVKGPEGRRTTLLPTDKYANILDDIEAQRNQVGANTDRLVNETYAEFTAGEIDESDLIDPTELADEGTIGQNSTGYFGYVAATLSGAGAAGDPQTAQRIAMDGSEYEGVLFYAGTGDGPGTIETGETYDPGAYNGSFLLATDDGVLPLEDRFRVLEQTDLRTDENVDSVNITDPTPETYEADEFINNSKLLGDAREQAQESPTPVFGGDGIDLPGLGGIGIGSVIIVVVVLVALNAFDIIFPD